MNRDEILDVATSSPIRVVLANMDELLKDIIRNLLAGERNLQVDEEVSSLHSLSTNAQSSSSIVVIEADPPQFVEACEILPDIRLVGIDRDWRHASVRFNELTREKLRDAIRCVAREDVT
jgi:hypothetical protein